MPKGLKHKTWTTSNIASGPRVLCCARSWQVAWHQVQDRLSNFRYFQAIVHILSLLSVSTALLGMPWGAIWSVVAQADLTAHLNSCQHTLWAEAKTNAIGQACSQLLAPRRKDMPARSCKKAKSKFYNFHVSQTFWMLRALGLVWARNPAAAYFKPRFISLEDQRRPISSFRAEASCRNSQSKAVSSPSPGSPSERVISVLTASMRPRTER